SACFMRFRPSNRNGLVTMPTVSAPISLAIWAMIGAAPVPVPPPMPQVTKTRSAPCRCSSTSARFSSIAWRPTSGRAPAPSPRVSFLPICTLMSLRELESAWASVFTEMNWTPVSCSSIMRLTALPPPPPTPTTFIRAFCAGCSSISNTIPSVIAVPPERRSEKILEPASNRTQHPLHCRRSPAASAEPTAHCYLPGSVEYQPHRDREPRGSYTIGEPAETRCRDTDPHWGREDVPDQLDHPGSTRRGAGQDHSPRQPGHRPTGPGHLIHSQLRHLLEPHVHDVSDQPARCVPRGDPGAAGQLDHFRLAHHRLVGRAIPDLELLGLGLGDLKTVDQVRGHVAAREPERGRVPQLASLKDGDGGASSAKLDLDRA